MFSAIGALLFAAAILLAGNGLQGTLLAVRGNIEGFPTTLIGVLMSCYFAGFILGCRINPGFIKSVGHIRTFVALASVASAATLLHPLVVHWVAWAILRAITGFCFAGLIMIIESWLNERATNKNRGALLSVYRVVDLSATMVGNALLATASPAGFHLFIITSIFISIALVPVALTRSQAPQPIETARLNLPKLFRVSPVAAVGAAMIGLGNAAFWAMGPVYAQKLGYGESIIAAFMSSVIVGAALLQWPLGMLSDRIDRRLVMVGSGAIGAAAALSLAAFGGKSEVLLLSLAIAFGAFIIPMFGLTAAHANDHAAPGAAVETNGGLLLLNACGSVVGALVGGAMMSLFGPAAVFNYIGAIYLTLCSFIVIRIIMSRGLARDEKTPFMPITKHAAPTIFEIQEENDAAENNAPAAVAEK
jgi:MFS family permease